VLERPDHGREITEAALLGQIRQRGVGLRQSFSEMAQAEEPEPTSRCVPESDAPASLKGAGRQRNGDGHLGDRYGVAGVSSDKAQCPRESLVLRIGKAARIPYHHT
jgi:hypothetical protein